MCDIIVIVQKPNAIKDKNTKAVLQEIIERKQDWNRDGSASLVLNSESGDFNHKRGERIKTKRIKKDLESYDLLNYHFRIRTSGEKGKKNFHLWRDKNWFFAHNGIATKWEKKGSAYCDSYHLFKDLLRQGILGKKGEIEEKKANDIVGSFGFSGRFIAINLKSKKIFFGGDFKAYNVNNNALVISSSRIDIEEPQELFGVKFVKEQELLEESIDGINTIGFEKKKMQNLCKKWKYSEYGQTNYQKSLAKENDTTLNEFERKMQLGIDLQELGIDLQEREEEEKAIEDWNKYKESGLIRG